MKYYSEKTKKMYDVVEDLKAAEKEYDKKHAAEIAKQKERKARAEEITKARQEIAAAQKHYNELVNSFIKDYGSYHETLTEKDTDIFTVSDLFRQLWGL